MYIIKSRINIMFTRRIFLFLVALIALSQAKQVHIEGTVFQDGSPEICGCGGKQTDKQIYNIPEGKPDCIPHVIESLSCEFYSYQFTIWVCNTYVGSTLSYGDPNNEGNCNTDDIGIGLTCRAKITNGLCVINGDFTITDLS